MQKGLAQAKPFMRLRTVHMVQLARTFIVLGDLDEAERLCRLLERNAANRPEVPALASQLATAWAKAGRVDLAQAWSGPVTFADVGALAYFLTAIPWVIEGFDVETHAETLARLHRRLQADGPLRFTYSRFLLRAVRR